MTLQPKQRHRVMQVVVKIAFQGALRIGDELLPHLAKVVLVRYGDVFANVGERQVCI